MPHDIRRLHQEAARRRLEANEQAILSSHVVVTWNAYRRKFRIRLDDADLGLERVTELSSKTFSRMALQLKALARQEPDAEILQGLTHAYGKALREDDGRALVEVDYRGADPNGFDHELGRFPVDLAPRAVRRILDGGFAPEKIGDAADAELAPRALAFAMMPIGERSAFESALVARLGARDPEHNRQSMEVTRALRDGIMAAPGFVINDQYRRAADMAELGRRALVDALRRARVLDPRRADADYVPLLADGPCGVRRPGPPAAAPAMTRPAPRQVGGAAPSL